MNVRENFIGALTLKNETFVALRANSDVFLRGFLVLFVAGLIVGVCAAVESLVVQSLPPPTQQEVIDIAVSSFRSQYTGPAAMAPMIESYVREVASMVYEILALPPRAGEFARPVGNVLTAVGSIFALPFSSAWAGWMLFAGLLIHFSSRLLGGRAGIAQMLGLTALAAAPSVLLAVNHLLGLLGAVTSIPLSIPITLIALVLAVWSAAIYIKATAVAQNFSIARSLGAILLAFGIFIGIFLVLVIILVAVGMIIATAAPMR